MNKIKALTGCSLEDGDEIMSMGLSYKLMRYLKMLPQDNPGGIDSFMERP